MENGFQGKPGQEIPEMTNELVNSVSDRYIELFEKITGEKFQKEKSENIENRIFENVSKYLGKL